MNQMIKTQNYLQWIVMDVSTLSGQGDFKLANLSQITKRENSYKAMIVLIVFWLVFTTIITKCFSSLLLNTYFKQTALPFVETLEQLLEEKSFSIASGDSTISLLYKHDVLTLEQSSTINYRSDQYLKKMESDPMSPGVFNDMIEGLAVYLLSSLNARLLEAIYFRQSDKYSVSHNKYLPNMNCLYIYKESIIISEFKFA